MTLIPLPTAAATLNLPTIVVRQLVRQDALTGYRIGGVLKVDDADLAGVRDVEVEQARVIVEGRAKVAALTKERDELRRAAAEAVRELDSITHGDAEAAHGEADRILLRVAPAEVREAWNRCEDRTGGFWYA